jgi:hypothetical protein
MNAAVIGGWTGLVRDDHDFHAREWLLEKLADDAAPECLLEPLLDRFAKEATERFRGITLSPRSRRSFTLLLAGYVYEAGFRDDDLRPYALLRSSRLRPPRPPPSVAAQSAHTNVVGKESPIDLQGKGDVR